MTADERGSDPAPGNPRRSDCCNRAPAVMVFDREGNLLKAWGGAADPGFLTTKCTPAMGCEWSTNEHGIYVDHMDYVYIAGNGGGNHQVLKFTNDGSFTEGPLGKLVGAATGERLSTAHSWGELAVYAVIGVHLAAVLSTWR